MSTALINVMSAAAIRAGKGVLRDFSEVDQLQVSRKGTANFVTATDVRTEKYLQRELLKVRPTFGFLLEEGGEIEGKDKRFRWVVDPIDGTSNFIHAVPYFCISIGVEERKSDGSSDIVAGVIYDPIHNELFAAEKGKGAFLNGRKITVSGRPSLEDALLVTGNPGYSSQPNRESYTVLAAAIESGAIVRYFGATALDLAYLAAGRIDGCWYHLAQPWDLAAGLVILREAGGMAGTFGGGPVDIYSRHLVASNEQLHEPLQKLLSHFS
jgi:myo-inositol-1(or 4)-monophosphatase